MLQKNDVLKEKTWTDTFPLRSKQEKVVVKNEDERNGIRRQNSEEIPDTEYGADSNELIEAIEQPVMYQMQLYEVKTLLNMRG